MGFDPLTEEGAAEHIVRRFEAGDGGRVATPNVDFLRQVHADPVLAELLAGASLVLADGMPIVWASRLARRALPARVAGSSLSPRVVALAAERGIGVFLLGGDAGTAQRAATELQRRHPALRVGWHYPPFGFEDVASQVKEVEAALDSFGPCICLIGLGFPKQDRLAEHLSERRPQTWFVGVGATISFLAGDRRRAPQWMRSSGTEWLYRLCSEPRRLAGRYTRDIPYAVRLLVASALAPRARQELLP